MTTFWKFNIDTVLFIIYYAVHIQTSPMFPIMVFIAFLLLFLFQDPSQDHELHLTVMSLVSFHLEHSSDFLCLL